MFYKKLLLLFVLSISMNLYASPKKVIFAIYTETLGGKGAYETYKEMKKMGHEVKVAFFPLDLDGITVIDETNFRKNFNEEDVLHIKQIKDQDNKFVNDYTEIEKYKADYIFIASPYHTDMNEKLRTFTNKLAYIIYYPSLFHHTHLKPKLDNIDTIFVDAEGTKEIYVDEYQLPPTKVVVSGYIPYKTMRDAIKTQVKHKEKTILWLPRWNLGFGRRDTFESGSTFLNYHYFFIIICWKIPIYA